MKHLKGEKINGWLIIDKPVGMGSTQVVNQTRHLFNATKNGQEIIDDLRIKYNKGRQAAITAELSDIVSGFEAIS